ncbi:MAG: MFS transporter [Saprospiraceae bacterium]
MKNLKAILLLFLANSISAIAQGISMIAVPWYFALQEEMGLFALIFLATTLISIFWSLYGGTLIDQYNRKSIFLGLCVITGTALFAISGLGFYQGHLSSFWVGAVFMITFLNYNLHFPAIYAFAQEIVPQAYYGKISSYLEIQHQITTITAGALAAILLEGTLNGEINFFGFLFQTNWQIAPWQIHEIFLMDASTYVVAFCIIALIKYESLVTRKKESGNLLAQFKVGWDYLKSEKGISIFGVASFSVFVCMLIAHFYLFPSYVKNRLLENGDVYAAGDMYYAIGAIFAGLAIRKVFSSMSIPQSVMLMTLLCTLVFLILAVSKNLSVYYGMLLFLGVTNAGVRIQRTTYLLEHIPNQVYGRTGSIFFLSNIVFRIIFLSLFSLPFFTTGDNVIYGMYLFSGFLFLSFLVLVYYRKAF